MHYAIERQYVHLVTQARRQTHVNPCKGIQIPESDKFFLACGIRNPTKDWIPESNVPLTKTGNQYWESGIRSAESRIQDCPGFPYMRQTPFNVKTA